MKVIARAISALVLLTGCANSVPPDAVLGDFGTRPADPERVVREYLANQLRDPEAAFVHILAPPIPGVPLGFGDGSFGWAFCALVFEPHWSVGWRTYYFHVHEGRVTKSHGTRVGSNGQAKGTCRLLLGSA